MVPQQEDLCQQLRSRKHPRAKVFIVKQELLFEYLIPTLRSVLSSPKAAWPALPYKAPGQLFANPITTWQQFYEWRPPHSLESVFKDFFFPLTWKVYKNKSLKKKKKKAENVTQWYSTCLWCIRPWVQFLALSGSGGKELTRTYL